MDNSVLNNSEQELVSKISSSAETGIPAKTKLKTDQKVLARVTDGIYRLPGSAIRELISNAYDADAENVIIETDMPRFESMTIRDDGNGMSVEALVNLLNHIGGSAKRNSKGSKLEVTNTEDTTLSRNKKRKLIGKIGIGLFSVAQLTRDFEIITKEKGKPYYLHAQIKLHNYSEEYVNKIENSDNSERGASFETGSVEIWTEKTTNVNAHGTDIILKNIKKSARDQLKSVDIWGQEKAQTDEDPNVDEDDVLNSSKLDKPKFHIGFSHDSDGDDVYDNKDDKHPELPWNETVCTSKKFGYLYDEILALTKVTTNPKLEHTLDNYLKMLWDLSLSVPLDYIEKHPFSYTHSQVKNVYAISNKVKGQVVEIPSVDGGDFASICNIGTPTESVGFNVVVDGIKLFRPTKFTELPKSKAVVTEPLLFIGSYSQEFKGINISDSGGEISFDAYILWTPKVIPRDHNGVLIRLHNSSGTMFDPTFMRHQVAEHTIKSQLTAEIFVNRGLDSALNIDRESFNVSHPHYQVLMTWLHQAIRQVVNKYKSVKREATAKQRTSSDKKFKNELIKLTEKSFIKRGVDTDIQPSFYLVENDKAFSSNEGTIETSEIPVESFRFEKQKFGQLVGSENSKRYKTVEAKTEAIFQLLDSYGLLEKLSPDAQQSLIEDIIQVLSFGE